MFRMDVAKVDRDVAYVAMVVHVCCTCLFPMFHQFLQTYVASVFIWMLHIFHIYVAMFYLNVAYVCNGFQVFFGFFLPMCQTHVLSVSSVFFLCCKCCI